MEQRQDVVAPNALIRAKGFAVVSHVQFVSCEYGTHILQGGQSHGWNQVYCGIVARPFFGACRVLSFREENGRQAWAVRRLNVAARELACTVARINKSTL